MLDQYHQTVLITLLVSSYSSRTACNGSTTTRMCSIRYAVLLPYPSSGCLLTIHAGKITESDMSALMDELSTVTQWYLLGIHLGVDLPTLAAIKADHEDTKLRLTHTLIQWLNRNRVTPTWSAVVKALVGIGRDKLASQLAEKHGMN